MICSFLLPWLAYRFLSAFPHFFLFGIHLLICVSQDPVNRSEAAAVFYLMLQRNYLEMEQFARMKLQATIAISRLTSEGVVTDEPQFQASLAAVRLRILIF
jgi:hypothetical protein